MAKAHHTVILDDLDTLSDLLKATEHINELAGSSGAVAVDVKLELAPNGASDDTMIATWEGEL